jgi:hypothetical protein
MLINECPTNNEVRYKVEKQEIMKQDIQEIKTIYKKAKLSSNNYRYKTFRSKYVLLYKLLKVVDTYMGTA